MVLERGQREMVGLLVGFTGGYELSVLIRAEQELGESMG